MKANVANANIYAFVGAAEHVHLRPLAIIWPKNRCASFLLFSRRGAEAQRETLKIYQTVYTSGNPIFH